MSDVLDRYAEACATIKSLEAENARLKAAIRSYVSTYEALQKQVTQLMHVYQSINRISADFSYIEN